MIEEELPELKVMTEEEPPELTDLELQKMADEMDIEVLDNLRKHFAERKQHESGDRARIFAMVHSHLQEAAALFDRHVVRAE